MKISVLLPSRKRVEKVKRFIQVIIDTVSSSSKIELVFRLDDDDMESIIFFNRSSLDFKIEIKTVIKPRIGGMSDCWNDAYEKCTGEIICVCGDDLLFKTKGWDVLVCDRFENIPDRIGLIHNTEKWGPGLRNIRTKTACHPFLHRNWIETLGYVMPPKFVYCGDTWLDEISKKIKREFLIPEMITEHHSFSAKRDARGRILRDKSLGEPDETWKEGIALNKSLNIGEKYRSEAMQQRRADDAKKLLDFIETFKENRV